MVFFFNTACYIEDLLNFENEVRRMKQLKKILVLINVFLNCEGRIEIKLEVTRLSPPLNNFSLLFQKIDIKITCSAPYKSKTLVDLVSIEIVMNLKETILIYTK